MTDLPPMVPTAYQRASAVADEPPSEFALFWKLEGALDAAYRDGRQSRQPEIDALRAALAEAERSLHDIIHGTDGYEEGETAYRLIREAVERGRAALARIREVKRKWLE